MGKASTTGKVESRSPAEFFAEHKSIAGFDNPGKSLYTTVREFVENSLDAAEEIGVTPDIDVQIEKVPDRDVSDLYGDKHRAAAAGKVAEPLSEDVKVDKKKPKKKKAAVFFRVTVQDNGQGMPHAQIPDMLGRVLSGTKYTLKQARGRFGLGAKMALIWSKMTTAKPLEIYSARPGSSTITYCQLDLDIHKNEPRVLKHTKQKNDGSDERFPVDWHGTRISVVIEGYWGGSAGYKWKIIKYMRLLAIITPYANLYFRYNDDEQSKDRIAIRYPRRTDVMPEPPKEVLHHPSSINLVVAEDLMRRAKLSNVDMTLKTFLTKYFSNVKGAAANGVIEALGKKFDEDTCVDNLTRPMVQHFVKILTTRDWPEPSGSSLSPAGQYNLYLGIMKELKPEMIATYQERAHVFQGHAFIVDAAVSLGGNTVDQGLNVFRFANRIPLLFESSSDVIVRTANELNWTSYKMNKKTDKIGVFVSLVSTKIPFKGTGKEFISDEIPPIKAAIKSALQRCCAQLKSKIATNKSLQAQEERKKSLTKYVPNVATAIFNVLQSMVEISDVSTTELPPPKRVKTVVDSDLMTREETLGSVKSGEVSRSLIVSKLRTHIDKHDATMALEYVAETGRNTKDNPPQDLHIIPMEVQPPSEYVLLKGESTQFLFMRSVCSNASFR